MRFFRRVKAALSAFRETAPPPGVDPARLDHWMRKAIAALVPFDAGDLRYEAARLMEHDVIAAFSFNERGDLYTTVAKGEHALADYLAGADVPLPERLVVVACERDVAKALRAEVQRRMRPLRLVR
jgi:hypothetical protein